MSIKKTDEDPRTESERLADQEVHDRVEADEFGLPIVNLDLSGKEAKLVAGNEAGTAALPLAREIHRDTIRKLRG